MKVINLFGGPGTGKSTLAASLFAAFKIRGYNAELVTEFAKDLVWSERNKELGDQVYILGKMYHKLWRLKDKVDVVIIDSPLPLCCYYDQGRTHGFEQFVMGLFDQFDNYNFLLERNFPYQQEGRYQDEAGANKVHVEIYKLLDALHIQFVKKKSPQMSSEAITSQAMYNSFVQTLVDEIIEFGAQREGFQKNIEKLEKQFAEDAMKPLANLRVEPDEMPIVLGPGSKGGPREKPRKLYAPPYNPVS